MRPLLLGLLVASLHLCHEEADDFFAQNTEDKSIEDDRVPAVERPLKCDGGCALPYECFEYTNLAGRRQGCFRHCVGDDDCSPTQYCNCTKEGACTMASDHSPLGACLRR